MGLQNDIKEYVLSTFGNFSAEKIDSFAKEIDPELKPKEFLEKCVDFLSTMLGEDAAKEKLRPFYEKYGVKTG